VTEAFVAGLSSGAYLALRLANRYSDLVKGLIAVNPMIQPRQTRRFSGILAPTLLIASKQEAPVASSRLLQQAIAETELVELATPHLNLPFEQSEALTSTMLRFLRKLEIPNRSFHFTPSSSRGTGEMLRYEISGAGYPLVLLAGEPLYTTQWEKQVESLSHSYTTITCSPLRHPDILYVLPPDGIQSILTPGFVSTDQAKIEEESPVIGVVLNGQSQAYSMFLLNAHEIVNDVVGGEKIAVTWCPLCSTAIVYSRIVNGQELTFGVTGSLWRNGLVMYDHQTSTLWSGITGEALEGALAGSKLHIFLSIQKIRWREWRGLYPESKILSVDGLEDPAIDQYWDYHSSENTGLFTVHHEDFRLPQKSLVIGVLINGHAKAYPFSLFKGKAVIQDTVAGEKIVIFRDHESDVTMVYERNIGGVTLEFERESSNWWIRDRATHTIWNMMRGKGISGPLAGMELKRLPHLNIYWFAWADFYPYTAIYDE